MQRLFRLHVDVWMVYVHACGVGVLYVCVCVWGGHVHPPHLRPQWGYKLTKPLLAALRRLETGKRDREGLDVPGMGWEGGELAPWESLRRHRARTCLTFSQRQRAKKPKRKRNKAEISHLSMQAQNPQ